MNYSYLSNDYNFIFIFLLIVITAFVIRILIIKKSNELPVNKPIAVLAIYISAICLIICLLSVKLGIFRIYTVGDPNAVVNEFYNSIIAKDWNTAYACLNNCDSLGLEKEILDENGEPVNDRVADILGKSYSYSISENAVVNGLSASQNVSFTYLDVKKLEEETSTYIEPILSEKIATLPKNDLYTDDDHYQASLMNRIYDEALDKSLKHVENFYVTINYTVTLDYKNGRWYLNPNDQMIKGFLGGQQ